MRTNRKTTLTTCSLLALGATALSFSPAWSSETARKDRVAELVLGAESSAQRAIARALHGLAGVNACSLTAELQARSGLLEAREDFAETLAACANFTDPEDVAECLEEAVAELEETLDEASAQFQARLELCALLGGGPYDPDIEPEDFSPDIDNPFLPFEVGHVWTYHADTEDGMEVIVVEVTPDTIEIDDVECRIVRDTVTLDGVLIEDTFDYFAQDDDGNVWYFGELSMNYEDGILVDLDGSWQSGEEFAKPGIVMFADPVVGETFRQEYLLGEAEDAGTNLSLAASASVPFGSFTNCLQTEDFTPVEPDSFEQKFYVSGVGLVLEVDLESGERVELISFVD